jgi:hypothetical protein
MKIRSKIIGISASQENTTIYVEPDLGHVFGSIASQAKF